MAEMDVINVAVPSWQFFVCLLFTVCGSSSVISAGRLEVESHVFLNNRRKLCICKSTPSMSTVSKQFVLWAGLYLVVLYILHYLYDTLSVDFVAWLGLSQKSDKIQKRITDNIVHTTFHTTNKFSSFQVGVHTGMVIILKKGTMHTETY